MSKLRKEQTEMIHIRVPVSIKKQIEETRASRRGQVNQTEIILAALRTYFDPTEADKREVALLRRLEMIERQIQLLKVQNEAIAESFSIFVKTYFAESIALRKANAIKTEDLTTARMQADAVYLKFIEKVGQNLNVGGEFFKNVPDQIFAPCQFSTHDVIERNLQGEPV